MAKIKEKIQHFTPMSIGNLIIFLIILYLMFVVGKTIWDNYQSNKGISLEEQKLFDLEYEVEYTENEISYFSSGSFKEKQARAKLGYALPGEKVISLPKDEIKELFTKEEINNKVDLKTPNYYLWYDYFFNS